MNVSSRGTVWSERAPGGSWILLVLLFAGATCAPQGPISTPGSVDTRYDRDIEEARAIVASLADHGAGVAAAVGVDGRLVWSEGFGRTSRSGGELVSPDMAFRVYSLIKPVTAVMALQSAGRGEVDLRASVREVIPTLPDRYEPVTLLQLLTHTGGVRHYHTPAEASLTEQCATAAEALPRFIDDPLVGVPGEGVAYSTWGFVLASAVLEASAGLPFDSLLTLRIAQPSRMSSTALEDAVGSVGAVAYYDADTSGDIETSVPVDNSCKMGGGGFVASAEDMVSFYNAVLGGDLVPLPAVRQMMGGRSILDGGGGGPGGQAVSRVDLDSRVAVVIVSNTNGPEQEFALERARELLTELFSTQR